MPTEDAPQVCCAHKGVPSICQLREGAQKALYYLRGPNRVLFPICEEAYAYLHRVARRGAVNYEVLDCEKKCLFNLTMRALESSYPDLYAMCCKAQEQ